MLDELTRLGLDTNKILSQCYDGASVMSGREGGMQKLVQNKLNREVPYVHCFNHQLHLVVVHAMSSESTVEDFFDVCTGMYKFLRKPTVAAQYKGLKLKRLLDQRWTGHLATVSVVLKSHNTLVEFFQELGTTRTTSDVSFEADGYHKSLTHPQFRFLAGMMHKVLELMDSPNAMLQAESTDILTGIKLIKAATSCIEELRSDAAFKELWAEAAGAVSVVEATPDPPRPKRQRKVSSFLKGHVVEQSLGQREDDTEQECKRLFFAVLDCFLAEMAVRFSERNGKYMQALESLDPASKNFLDPSKVQPLLDLTKTEMNKSQFIVARAFILQDMQERQDNMQERQDKNKVTLAELVSEWSSVLKSMPVVMTAFKHALTFGASTAMCENSFSTLKNVFSEHRRSMLHTRKANLIQLAFENDLSVKFRDEWKELLLRRFSSNRRMQLY